MQLSEAYFCGLAPGAKLVRMACRSRSQGRGYARRGSGSRIALSTENVVTSQHSSGSMMTLDQAPTTGDFDDTTPPT